MSPSPLPLALGGGVAVSVTAGVGVGVAVSLAVGAAVGVAVSLAAGVRRLVWRLGVALVVARAGCALAAGLGVACRAAVGVAVMSESCRVSPMTRAWRWPWPRLRGRRFRRDQRRVVRARVSGRRRRHSPDGPTPGPERSITNACAPLVMTVRVGLPIRPSHVETRVEAGGLPVGGQQVRRECGKVPDRGRAACYRHGSSSRRR